MAVRRFIAAGLALLVASSVPLVQAQVTSNATCAPQYSWMLNSKQQTPCMASAYLSAQCNDGQWNVPGIGPDGPYNHPNGAGANLCRCNTVVYNLLSACSICQGGNAGNWANWISNCTAGNVTIGHYPLPLPPGAAIPSWAYLDFTSQDMFQVNVAQQYATASPPPESMSSPGQSQPLTSNAGSPTSQATNTGTKSISNPVGTSTPTAPPASGGSSNTGAIAGGVVGGVLGLAVLALIAWLLARKKSQQTQVAPSEKFGAQDNGYPVQQPYNAGQYAPVPPNQGGYNNQGHPGFAQPYAAPETPGTGYKPYDPSDPSTFPATPANGGAPTIYSQGPTEYSHPRPGQYNYAAEL